MGCEFYVTSRKYKNRSQIILSQTTFLCSLTLIKMVVTEEDTAATVDMEWATRT